MTAAGEKETGKMNSPRHPIATCVAVVALSALAALVALGASQAAAAGPGPVWDLTVTSNPTNLAPGATGTVYPQYTLIATNIGAGPTAGPITVSDTLPAGLTPVKASGINASIGGKRIEPPACPISSQTVTCTVSDPVTTGKQLRISISLNVDGGLTEGSTLLNQAAVSGGGAPPANASATTTISSSDASFDFLDGDNGLGGLITEADGSAATQAGSHPDQLTMDFDFPTTAVGSQVVAGAEGGLRDLRGDLPAGMIVNPTATPVRCSEIQLETDSCPDAAQVGSVVVLTQVVGVDVAESPLYTMVPPPGVAAQFGFDAEGVSIFIHIDGGVRPGDYVETGGSKDILALTLNPVFGVQLRFWGDPSDPSHDPDRGECAFTGSGFCPNPPPSVTKQDKPLLSMPTSCTESMQLDAHADSWGNPSTVHERSATFRDVFGNVPEVGGCNLLEFSPTLKARPTTNAADAPSGLSVDLHIPQSASLGALATAHLRKAEVTLPEGLVLNPSSANGLAGCSSSQVGIDPASGIADGAPAQCPDASRVGSVEVDSPLVDHALSGSVYVATPHDNPFDSLLAIYVVINDPQSGVLVKLSGHVEPDPATGQLTTTFDRNPQLPFTDFKLEFFGGAGGVLRTPSVCGSYSTTSQMTPWSAPASGPPATPSDSYPISGGCARDAASEPNAPEFSAGTVSPIAGKYTPFVVHLKREDGSQEFSRVTVSPPPGLLAKLAGVPYCSDSALAAVTQRSGAEEKASPSCPAASRIGTVHVAAGAGPAPYWTQGTAYLTGPYKGAPLGMAVIVPATAGPYDLGTVVTRVALRVDSTTAHVTAEADPIPEILEGVPLDVRQIEIALDRDQFARTGTSCEPMSISGQLISTLGRVAPLSNPFQLGNCANLRFRPSLGIRLLGKTGRGANPALRATLSMPEGSANIAKAVVALPHSEFIDQAHFRTICTRVQFDAGAGHGAQCPPGSVYGQARATSPLLGAPLEGPAILRSSSHELPDLVIALHGQIDVEVVGRVDSVRGGIRTSFETVPDAPVSRFTLAMQGGKKGLFENSTNICKTVNRASASFDAQSGAAADLHPALTNPKCRAHKRNHRRSHKAR